MDKSNREDKKFIDQNFFENPARDRNTKLILFTVQYQFPKIRANKADLLSENGRFLSIKLSYLSSAAELKSILGGIVASDLTSPFGYDP